MLSNEWKKLQNGSDIRGVALDGIKGQTINLTNDNISKIGAAFAKWLSNKKNKPIESLNISLGHDSRLSANMMLNAAISGILSVKSNVVSFGLASTPAMFMSTVTKGFMYDGGIMITASHLPFNRNGLKFFTSEGGLDKKDITSILEIAESIDENIEIKNTNIKNIDFISEYSNILVKKIRTSINSKTNYEKPLEGLKIIVDAGNGAGGFFADKVLKPLGADTTGSQFLDPDGSFPNHIPNPEDGDAMESIKAAVLKNKADFGIIFDTDVDRAGAVDKNGKEINRNRIIALMSSIILQDHPGSTIVTDSITSSGLKKFIEDDLKGIHHRFKRGYKNVINESIRLNSIGEESQLAIETSGHGALKENYFLDDGAYIIAKILIKIAKLKEENKSVDILLNDLDEPLESKEFRLNISAEDFSVFGNKIINDLFRYAKSQNDFMTESVNHEGIRVSFDQNNGDGWFLLRLSLHDPLMPLNIESNSIGGVKQIAKKLIEFLKDYEKLDISSVKIYCI